MPILQQLTSALSAGTIEVIVTDEGGLRVPGVVVAARSADAVTTRTATTDQEGRALLVGLDPSTQYVVTSELAGFKLRVAVTSARP